MDNKSMTIDDLIPLYRSQSKILVGLKADYVQGVVQDGLALEIDTRGKRIINNPWSGQKKLKFSGYYESIPDNERKEVLLEIQNAFHETVIMEMVDLLLHPSEEAVGSLIWLPDRLKNPKKVCPEYPSLSSIQRKKFLGISGREYVEGEHSGYFWTDRPFNSDDYRFSPRRFEFKFDAIKGFLVCEIAHKFTNNQVYGWDHDGNELPDEIKYLYFKDDGLGIEIIKE